MATLTTNQHRNKSKQFLILCITILLGTTTTVVHCQTSSSSTTTTTAALTSSSPDSSADAAAAAVAAASTTTTFAAQSKKLTAACGLNGNTDTICSPKAGDTWKNGTWYPITWNPLYPSYVSSSMLDIYIYFVQNYQNILIKKVSDVNTSKGSVPVLVDDTWRLDPLAQTYDSFVYIVPSGVNPEKELNNRYSDYPPPVHNLVAQAAIVPPSATALPSNTSSASSSIIASNTATMLSAPTNQIPIAPPNQLPTPPNLTNLAANKQDSAGSQQHNAVQPGIIAAIVLACLAVLAACLAVLWVMRQSRKRKQVYGEKGHLELNSTASSSMFPMSSREKLHQPNSNSNHSIANPAAAIHNYSNPTGILTAPKLNGAARTAGGSLKSHTAPTTPTNNNQQFGFISVPSLPLLDDQQNNANRGGGGIYMLDPSHRPDSTASFSNRSSRSEPPLTSTDALLIADTFRQRMRRPNWQKSQETEDSKRRQLSEELLKHELEAEGTLMKKVGKRAHLLAATYQQQQQDDDNPPSSSS